MRDRSLGVFRLSLYFTGCFLGAGFLSGKEIWEFFGIYGSSGFLFILPSFCLVMLTAFIILKLVSIKHTRSTEELVLPFSSPLTKTVFTVIQAVFLFGIAVIMAAGASALFEQLISLPGYIGGIFFCIVTIICSVSGIRGVVRVFSCTVPILAAFVCILCLLGCSSLHTLPASTSVKHTSVLPMIFSAVLYASYNLFGSVPLIAAVSDRLKNNISKTLGLILGTLLMVLIAVCVYLCQLAMPVSTQEELPLLAVAQSYGTGVGILFGLLLLCAMFGTALSTLVAANDMMALKWPVTGSHSRLLAVIEFILMTLGSFLGFGKLISFIYPAFGYAGIVLIFLLAVNLIKVKRSTP